jgi:hypothetical protein
MTRHLPGTWRWVKHSDKKGNVDSSYVESCTFTYRADGTGSINKPDGLSHPLTWEFVGGRLRYVAHWGAGAKMQTTVDFEMPTADQLILVDRFHHRDVFERVKDDKI